MDSLKELGRIGEQEVVKLVPCPNCKSKLMLLPRDFPRIDVQCTYCQFEAQVKSKSFRPRGRIRGATWDILEASRKIGLVIPRLIVNFKWVEKGVAKQEIRFYPYISPDNIKKSVLSAKAKRPNLAMYDYVGLKELPYLVLFKI